MKFQKGLFWIEMSDAFTVEKANYFVDELNEEVDVTDAFRKRFDEKEYFRIAIQKEYSDALGSRSDRLMERKYDLDKEDS